MAATSGGLVRPTSSAAATDQDSEQALRRERRWCQLTDVFASISEALVRT